MPLRSTSKQWEIYITKPLWLYQINLRFITRTHFMHPQSYNIHCVHPFGLITANCNDYQHLKSQISSSNRRKSRFGRLNNYSQNTYTVIHISRVKRSMYIFDTKPIAILIIKFELSKSLYFGCFRFLHIAYYLF